MFKIRSKFYVIYGDEVPIYVGYTNRTVAQRFSEHKKSKDFSDYDIIKVQELKTQELSFDFTWDLNVIYDDATKVSKREISLIHHYNTQNSYFQKASGGGQNWANIKYFVLSNKDNPKYTKMNGEKIYEYLVNRKKEMDILGNFIGKIGYPSRGVLSSFAEHIEYPNKIILNNFVGRIHYPSKIILGSFIESIECPSKTILNSFIGNINYKSKIILNSFIGNIRYPSKNVLNTFIGNMKIKKEK